MGQKLKTNNKAKDCTSGAVLYKMPWGRKGRVHPLYALPEHFRITEGVADACATLSLILIALAQMCASALVKGRSPLCMGEWPHANEGIFAPVPALHYGRRQPEDQQVVH